MRLDKIELSAAGHLAFDELQSVDVPFGLAVRLRLGDPFEEGEKDDREEGEQSGNCSYDDGLRLICKKAIAWLLGWSDKEIMGCDLARLEMAVNAAAGGAER